MIEKFCRPIVGRGGRKGRQTGQVLPVRPINGRMTTVKDPVERFAIDRIHVMLLRTCLAATSFVAAVMWMIWAQAAEPIYGPSSLQSYGAAGSTRRALL